MNILENIAIELQRFRENIQEDNEDYTNILETIEELRKNLSNMENDLSFGSIWSKNTINAQIYQLKHILHNYNNSLLTNFKNTYNIEKITTDITAQQTVLLDTITSLKTDCSDILVSLNIELREKNINLKNLIEQVLNYSDPFNLDFSNDKEIYNEEKEIYNKELLRELMLNVKSLSNNYMEKNYDDGFFKSQTKEINLLTDQVQSLKDIICIWKNEAFDVNTDKIIPKQLLESLGSNISDDDKEIKLLLENHFNDMSESSANLFEELNYILEFGDKMNISQKNLITSNNDTIEALALIEAFLIMCKLNILDKNINKTEKPNDLKKYFNECEFDIQDFKCRFPNFEMEKMMHQYDLIAEKMANITNKNNS